MTMFFLDLEIMNNFLQKLIGLTNWINFIF